MSQPNNNDNLNSGYDRGITPAEVAARKQREGQNFKRSSHQSKQTDSAAIQTSNGYTVDREGLLNNYAIELEMYINKPGDLQQQTEAEAFQRRHELEELQEDGTGKLTAEHDLRYKGPGLI
ncbi:MULTISPECIES: hypothetical protein [unclassified Leptolyngbya]|uniref:hypothetical protein n=1 Tax=unclassified Leptolyngbya TaxID=2650499 RepID=UPI0016858BB1|nr:MULTISPECIES: hypothetical protein [unclassified Leptolyngbya]MBD1909186.1 hypothetical protein [Leptolyngbya sp. FACHB-8]MBD2158433.1 hypothetical protein [Leptolyngbya sp. FACHB-16]